LVPARKDRAKVRENTRVNHKLSSRARNPGVARIALGTAQFGLDYGISNTAGQVKPQDAAQILALARDSGIDTLDTAIAYGESESLLGRLGVDGWNVVSKLPAFPADAPDLVSWSIGQVRASLSRLGIPRLDALLLHAPAQLAGSRGDELFSALRALRDAGLVRRIGASIYAPAELEALGRFRLDVVQAPFNVLDRGLNSSGWAQRLADEGVEIHLRSVFLQGLLLMEPARRPSRFARWQATWDAWDAWLRETGLSPVQACVRHALAQPFAHRVVLGVAALCDLQEILAAADGDMPPVPESLRSEDPALINPSTWKLS
jgi:aryl-alcohol dehydrogenase-like predicted oxidoreductase